MNPNITMKDISTHPNEAWDWDRLSMNLFKHSPEMQIITIKGMQIVRSRHRMKMQLGILYSQSGLCIDLINLIMGPLRSP